MTDWELHFIAMCKKLNVFVSTGHTHYIKSAKLYVQKILKLSADHH